MGEDLRARALALAEEELPSYEPVLEALRLHLHPDRPERLAAALTEASNTPAEIAEMRRRRRSSARGRRPPATPPCAATP